MPNTSNVSNVSNIPNGVSVNPRAFNGYPYINQKDGLPRFEAGEDPHKNSVKLEAPESKVKFSLPTGKPESKPPASNKLPNPVALKKAMSQKIIAQSRRKSAFNFKVRKVNNENVGKHICSICGDTFVLKRMLKRHVRSQHCNDTFNCHLCGRIFLRKCGLASHINMHAKQKGSKCNICNKQFMDVSSMRRHQKMHNGVKGFACDVCNKEFWRKDGLQEHIKRHHSQPQNDSKQHLEKEMSSVMQTY